MNSQHHTIRQSTHRMTKQELKVYMRTGNAPWAPTQEDKQNAYDVEHCDIDDYERAYELDMYYYDMRTDDSLTDWPTEYEVQYDTEELVSAFDALFPDDDEEMIDVYQFLSEPISKNNL